jgi:hypothetical protein
MTAYGSPGRAAHPLWIGVFTLALGACARPQATDKTATVASPKPGDGDSRTQGAAARAPDTRTRSSVTSGCAPKERATDIHRRLLSEAGQAFAFRRATPLLVDRWPNPTAVLVYTYETHALPTGRVAFEVESPEWELRISPLGRPVEVTHLSSMKKLGHQENSTPTDEGLAQLREAEEVLVEVVAGCRSPDQACKALGSYQTWYQANPVIGRYLTGRLGVALPCLRPH